MWSLLATALLARAASRMCSKHIPEGPAPTPFSLRLSNLVNSASVREGGTSDSSMCGQASDSAFSSPKWRGRHMHKAEALLRETRERRERSKGRNQQPRQQRSSGPLVHMYASLVRHYAREGHVSKVVTLLQQMRDDLAASGRKVPPQATEAVVFACARAVYRSRKRREKVGSGGGVASDSGAAAMGASMGADVREKGGEGSEFGVRGVGNGGAGEEEGEVPADALVDHASAAMQELAGMRRAWVHGRMSWCYKGGRRRKGKGGWAVWVQEGWESGREENGAGRQQQQQQQQQALTLVRICPACGRAMHTWQRSQARLLKQRRRGEERRQRGGGRRQRRFFREMLRAERGPLTAAFNSLLQMYLHQSRLNDLERRFQGMKEVGCIPDRTSYHLRLAAHIKAGNLGMAKRIFLEMNSNKETGADGHTYNLLIAACGAAGDTRAVRSLYVEMVGNRKDRGRKPGMVLVGAAREAAEAVVGKLRVLRDESRSMKLSKEQRQVLAGVLLGGARIAAQDNERTYEIHFEQPLDNPGRVDLLEALFRAFGPWASAPPRNMLLLMPPAPSASPDAAAAAAAVAANTAATTAAAAAAAAAAGASDPLAAAGVHPIRVRHFATIPHTSLRYHAQRYHPQGNRAVPKLIQRWLTPKTLAHWYMYSGRRCEDTGGMILHAKQYSSRDLRRIARALCVSVRDCWVKMRYRRPGQRAQMGRVALESPWDAPNLIRFGGATATRLWKFMEGHVLPSLRDELRPGVRMRFGGGDSRAGGASRLDVRGGGLVEESGERECGGEVEKDGGWEEEVGETMVGGGGLMGREGKEGGEVWSDDAWGSDGSDEVGRDEDEEEDDEEDEDEEEEEGEDDEDDEGDEDEEDENDVDDDGDEDWEEDEEAESDHHREEGGGLKWEREAEGKEQESFLVKPKGGDDSRQGGQHGLKVGVDTASQLGIENREGRGSEPGGFERRRGVRGRGREKDTREEIGLNEWIPLELALYMEKVQTPVFKKKPKKRR
ncbi:hypothetical protein CLOP_g10555 [Closterium sp. NIES-67]|nr:hypothetical protein CLOP_g10555 [Closterium sp. NIES-67]